MPVELGSFSIGFVAGGAVVGVINHFLAKSRDEESRTAKDFNAAADIMADILRKERNCPTPGSNIDFFAFRRVLYKRDLARFDKCIEEYERAIKSAQIKHYDNSGGLVICGQGRFYDEAPIVAAIDKLLEFTKRK